MQSTRLAVVVTLGFVLLACSSTTVGTGGGDAGDDDDTTDAGGATGEAGPEASTSRDSGDDDASDDDAGDGGDSSVRRMDGGACSPVDPPDTFAYRPPLQMPGACSSTQVTDYVDACGYGATSATCAPFRLANPTCIACLESETADPSWGAVVIDRTLDEEDANSAGCVVALDGDSDSKACAAQYEDILLCVAAACDQPCDESSYDYGQACEQAALADACLSYVNAANDCVQNIPATYTDTCKVSSSYGYNETVTAVATVLCVGQ